MHAGTRTNTDTQNLINLRQIKQTNNKQKTASKVLVLVILAPVDQAPAKLCLKAAVEMWGWEA